MPSSDAAAGTATVHREALIQVDTAEGTGRFFVAPAVDPRAQLFLGHGAGGGVDAVDLSELARALPEHGITVVRFEQPWRTAGGRVASRPPRLDIAWNDALLAPCWTGGSCYPESSRPQRCSSAVGAPGPGSPVGPAPRGRWPDGCPVWSPAPSRCTRPDRPERSRVLRAAGPLRPASGAAGRSGHVRRRRRAPDRPGCRRMRIRTAGLRGAGRPAGVEVVRMPGADHSMRLGRRADHRRPRCGTLLVHSVLGFVDGVLG